MTKQLTKLTQLLLFCFFVITAQAQTSLKGTVKDANGESLIGAAIVVKNTGIGAITDEKGAYSLEVATKPPFTVACSFVGYATKEILVTASGEQTLDFVLGQNVNVAEEVTISASRIAEKITQSPATVSIINAKQIEETPTFNIGELAARQKGVDYVRAGVLGTGLNVRGFNSAFNPKNLQLNDNRISSLIATGLPFGALGTIVKEDIERVEIVLGPSSALYGPNAGNGLVNTITKDPRTSQGTTIAFGGGTQSVLTTRLRHAQVLNEQFAFKISGEYTRGTEFDYIDTVYIGSDPRTAQAKTELDLNRDFNTLRGEAALYYTPVKGHDLILSYGGSNSNNLAQTNAGRNQIKDWKVQYFQLRYVSPRVFAQAYYTMSSTDSTYAINQLTQNYWSFVNAGFTDAEARGKMFQKQFFATSATPRTGIELNRGALFQDKSRRFNAEVQYNNTFGIVKVIGGLQFQRDMANSRKTYLLDDSSNIIVNQIGGYVQADATLAERLKVVLAARGDNHDLYGFNFIPKAALVYLMDNGSVRLTYGQGITAPTILNLEANIFGGVLLGNGQGYTLSDGTVIDPLKVEKVQTIELGYKGSVNKKLFIDANAYYNISKDFISPSINIATGGRTVTKRGDKAMSTVVPGTPTTGSALLLTYVNFGNVNTYGFDLGVNYYVTDKFNVGLNYSYFGYQLDTADKKNDGDRNGLVTPTDLPINTPSHKASLALNYSDGKWFGSVFTRWVAAYDFFSGINVAAKANNDVFTNLGAIPALGLPAQRYTLQENARYGRYFNRGPLGGFVNVDLSLGYRFNQMFTLAGQVINVFDSNVREFVAAPAIGRMAQLELKINLPAIKNK